MFDRGFGVRHLFGQLGRAGLARFFANPLPFGNRQNTMPPADTAIVNDLFLAQRNERNKDNDKEMGCLVSAQRRLALTKFANARFGFEVSFAVISRSDSVD